MPRGKKKQEPAVEEGALVPVTATGEVLPAEEPVRFRRGASEAVRRLYEKTTGVSVPCVEEDPHWQPPALQISIPLMSRLTYEGLATVAAAAEDGNVRAAMYLVDRGLGAIGEGFEAKTRRYPLEKAKQELEEELRKLGLTPEQVSAYVQRALAPAEEG